MNKLVYFQDITLIEQPEISLGFLWSKVFMQLHLALADIKSKKGISDIGISIPEYQQPGSKFPLGTKLRVFAISKERLDDLNLELWFKQLSDYIHIRKEPRKVPERLVSSYAIFSRKVVKSGVECLARRRARKDPSITYEEALRRLYLSSRDCNLPYVNLKSLSSNHDFKLFIERKMVDQTEDVTEFSSYGLSKVTAVPIF